MYGSWTLLRGAHKLLPWMDLVHYMPDDYLVVPFVITYCCWWFFIHYLSYTFHTDKWNVSNCFVISRLWCWYRPGVSGTPPTPVLTSWPCRTEPVIPGPGQDILGINVTFPPLPSPHYLFPLFLQLSLPLTIYHPASVTLPLPPLCFPSSTSHSSLFLSSGHPLKFLSFSPLHLSLSLPAPPFSPLLLHFEFL